MVSFPLKFVWNTNKRYDVAIRGKHFYIINIHMLKLYTCVELGRAEIKINNLVPTMFVSAMN